MAVVANKPYIGAVKDSVDKFHGNQLLFVGWEDHLFFCAPFAFHFRRRSVLAMWSSRFARRLRQHPDWKKSTGAAPNGSNRAALAVPIRPARWPTTVCATRM